MRRFWLARPAVGGEAPFSVFRDIAQIHDEMSRLFDDFGRGVLPADKATEGMVSPKMDLYRQEGKIVLELEIPGIDPKDVDLKVYPDRVIFRTEKKQGKKEETDQFFRIERRSGSFYREIALPVEVDPDGAEARTKNGLLSLILPEKQEVEEGRKLEIKQED